MPLFDLFRRQPAPAPTPRRFLLDQYYEFDTINQFCLMICAADWPKDFCYTIFAEPGGRIDLRVNGEVSYFREMLRSIDPSVAAFFCSAEHYNGDSYGYLRFSFQEPDCYIYGCSEGPFQNEVTDYAPNGYVNTFKKYPNGNLYIEVKFQEQDEDARYDNFLELKKKCNIFLK